MQLEFHQLERRWEHLRARHPSRQRRLLASLADVGQQTPIVVVAAENQADLFLQGVSVSVIENAFVLAATRRLMRPADARPLGAIRSLAYFLSVIEEVRELRVSPDYFQYLRHKLQRIAPTR